MALVNPNIAMSFRAPDIQPQNMLADYAALQQIQGGRQAQELNALKMQEARATMEERNALRQLNPSAADYESQLFKVSPQLGIQYRKEAATAAAQKAAQSTSEFDLKAKQRSFMDKVKLDLSSNPSDDNVRAFGQDAVIQGIYSKEVADREVAQLLAMPPEKRAQLLSQSGATVSERAPKVLVGPSGAFSVSPFGGPATPVAGAEAAFQMTPAQIAANKIAQQQLGVSQGQLGVAQQRLAQEGQGVTYQTDEQGNLMALPSRLSAGVAPMARPVIGEGGVAIKGAPKSKDIAVSEQQAAYNIGRVLTAANEIKKIGEKDPRAIQPGAGEALAASVGMSGTANLARNANRQIVRGAQRDALDALLYLATGAAYNKEQLEGQMEAYIPAFTDEPETLVAKKERMTALIKSAKTRAGKAWTPAMDASMKALTEPVSAAPPANAITNPKYPGFSIGKP